MCTMGDIALCSEKNEDLLYKLFGKNAELLIDKHAHGTTNLRQYTSSTRLILDAVTELLTAL